MWHKKVNLVETTNDLSIVSKASIVKRGYVDDPFVRYFVQRSKHRSPLINRGYFLRFKAINFALNDNSYDLIISLGSGFDTLPFRNDFHGKLIEIDFIDVALNKAKVILKNSLLSPISFEDLNFNEKSSSRIVLRTENYCLIGADLRDSRSLCQLLIDSELFNEKCKKIGILNECSLCYIEQHYSDKLLKDLLCQLVNFEVDFISYEMLNSDAENDAFTNVMTSHFETIGSPLKTLLTKDENVERMKKIGFTEIKVIDMLTFWRDLVSDEEKCRIYTLEPFDEYEEFDLLCCNYALTIAKRPITNEDCPDLKILESLSLKTENSVESSVKYELCSKYLRRFAHCLCETGTDNVFIFGGFGFNETNERKHQRLSDIQKFNLKTKSIQKCIIDGVLESRMHSQFVYLNEDYLLLIGGRSSPVNPFGCTFLRRVDENRFVVEEKYTKNVPHLFRHSCVCLDNSVITIGGKGFDKNTFCVYDVNRNEWRSENYNDFNRHSHSSCVFDKNTLIITGGLDIKSNRFMDNSCLLDLRSNKSSALKNLPKIYSHTSHIDSNRLYICGGISSIGSRNQILVYDMRNESVLGSIELDKRYKMMLHNHCSVIFDKILYTMGGGGNCFSFGTHINEYSLEINL